ncbi:hypothetical protein [Vibrio panuliri]|uniref:DUF4402 domain-containing protein n=1 Tax=Vibrio panuliri TaxID=1381081 RepID=A0A1Q9HP84_9VIBR|nr:hypothetical protein [Vibrio panuliri]KAB1455113.1 hypothetical protein F7O85_19925 [Vibrio panuliri]OLQ92664.1 hypothetical protein BIY22_15180 [Vibrio panuliri]OLQ94841.1 hypothetical protein BIY20_00685 [Vibrio panuliri]
MKKLLLATALTSIAATPMFATANEIEFGADVPVIRGLVIDDVSADLALGGQEFYEGAQFEVITNRATQEEEVTVTTSNVQAAKLDGTTPALSKVQLKLNQDSEAGHEVTKTLAAGKHKLAARLNVAPKDLKSGSAMVTTTITLK